MNHAAKEIEAVTFDNQLAAIAAKVGDLIITLQMRHPEWIQVDARQISLADKRQVLNCKLLKLLSSSSDPQIAIKHTLYWLDAKLLDPAVAQTAFYLKLKQLLVAELSAIVVPLQLSDHDQDTWPEPKAPTDEPPRDFQSQELSILLLDAENIDLNQEAEAWLETQCEYPLALKFAFGNWTRLGKRDVHFHQRGYHLIHVPAGKNHADAKMTIVGASIWVHLPTTKAVIVCSNDSDLDNLRNTLRFQGLDVSLLERHQQTLTLTNGKTKQRQTLKLSTPPKMPSVKQGKQFCQQYLQVTDPPVSLSQLSLAFSRALGYPMSAFVKHHQLGKTPKAFLTASPDFELRPEPGSSVIWVSLPEPPAAKTANDSSAANGRKAFTAETLSVVCVGITKHLLRQEKGDAVVLAKVAATFRQQYDQSLKAVLKQLGLSSNLPKFLQTCEALKVKQKQKQWMISLAKQ